MNTLNKVFNNVYIIPCSTSDDLYVSQNTMVIASDDELTLEGTYNLVLEEDEIVITDDYCPIDNLIADLID